MKEKLKIKKIKEGLKTFLCIYSTIKIVYQLRRYQIYLKKQKSLKDEAKRGENFAILVWSKIQAPIKNKAIIERFRRVIPKLNMVISSRRIQFHLAQRALVRKVKPRVKNLNKNLEILATFFHSKHEFKQLKKAMLANKWNNLIISGYQKDSCAPKYAEIQKFFTQFFQKFEKSLSRRESIFDTYKVQHASKAKLIDKFGSRINEMYSEMFKNAKEQNPKLSIIQKICRINLSIVLPLTTDRTQIEVKFKNQKRYKLKENTHPKCEIIAKKRLIDKIEGIISSILDTEIRFYIQKIKMFSISESEKIDSYRAQ